MLIRAVFFAAVAVALALVVGQVAPSWIASHQEAAAPPAPQIAKVESRPEPPLDGRQIALRAGPGGHVIAEGIVGGRSVTFLVDTGATLVVLNENTARGLGFHPARSDFNQVSRTANGSIAVAPIRINEIRVGTIIVRDVPAVIVPAGALDGNLLGMSFLNRLRKFEFQGDRLVLTQ